MTQLLSGQVVLVTGANSGIGEAIAVAFRQAGATVFGLVRQQEALEAVRARHHEIQWRAADVSRAQEVKAAVEGIAREAGRLDVVVNNAGIFKFAPLDQASEELVRGNFEANVFGTTYVAQAALPALRAARGTIINISSAAGLAVPRRRALRGHQGGGGIVDALVGPRAGAARGPRQRRRPRAHRHARLRQVRHPGGPARGRQGVVQGADPARADGGSRGGRALGGRPRRSDLPPG